MEKIMMKKWILESYYKMRMGPSRRHLSSVFLQTSGRRTSMFVWWSTRQGPSRRFWERTRSRVTTDLQKHTSKKYFCLWREFPYSCIFIFQSKIYNHEVWAGSRSEWKADQNLWRVSSIHLYEPQIPVQLGNFRTKTCFSVK